MHLKKIVFAKLVLVFSFTVNAQVRLPSLVRDSMILQRDAPVNIWGWAAVNEKISLRFKNKTYKTAADKSGKWLVKLPPTPAGGPYTLDIAASNKISLKEILFGDVWFCSGQSNMVHQLNIHDVSYAKDIAEANYPMIRQFWIPTLTSLQGPKDDYPAGNWKSAVGEDVRPFSGVAYFFAKTIYDKYHIPIGIINSSVGGPPVEAWTSEEGLKNFPAAFATLQKNKDTAYINSLTRRPAGSTNRPAPPTDPGSAGSVKWYDPAYIPKGWRNINVPGYWEDQGLKDLNGIVWYRKEIDVPASMTGKAARIFLGRIVDTDELYINGTRVGNTTYQYPQRRYHIASTVLKPGKNILVIRVTNSFGKGGFVPDKPYCIFAGTDTIDLKGSWLYKVGAAYRPVTGRQFGGGGGIDAQSQPAALYNAMVAPAIHYTIKGFCWYQGEGNTGRPAEYAASQAAQIEDWRNKWGQGRLPFLYVQLPNFMDYNYQPSESNWAALRESQLKALHVPNTAMAVTIDLGEWNDLHPDNKKDIGIRLALAALKLAYNENIVYSGPLYRSSTIEGNKIIISFDHVGGGLITIDEEDPADFAIAGADKKFVWAKAKIEGDKVIVWSDEIPQPKYVRYAWADNPVNPNLYNKEKLPASPFRTD
jgi:sialate O-acetylesterase